MTKQVEPLLTRGEVAELIRKPVSWLRYAERTRRIPFVRVGQQIRYRPADIRAWLDRHSVREEGEA